MTQGSGSLHYTADRSNSRGTFWGKTRMYVQKWHLQHKTSDISEPKLSIAKFTTVSIETHLRHIDW